VKFLEGCDCAQSILYAYCDDLGFDKNTALKIASGFGGGMACKGEVCGAVTGGIIVIGAKYGRGEGDDRSAADLTYVKTRELMDKFAERHGTFICRELLNGCNLTTKEGWKIFKENDLLNKVCVPCVQGAMDILENILQSAQPQ
jgi:C_GCAxxG_C_C family probable redox protein